MRKIFRQFQSATDHFPYHDIEKSHKGRTRGWRLEDDKASILSDMILAAKKIHESLLLTSDGSSDG